MKSYPKDTGVVIKFPGDYYTATHNESFEVLLYRGEKTDVTGMSITTYDKHVEIFEYYDMLGEEVVAVVREGKVKLSISGYQTPEWVNEETRNFIIAFPIMSLDMTCDLFDVRDGKKLLGSIAYMSKVGEYYYVRLGEEAGKMGLITDGSIVIEPKAENIFVSECNRYAVVEYKEGSGVFDLEQRCWNILPVYDLEELRKTLDFKVDIY